MKTMNTIINSIMQNGIKYLWTVLTVLGISVNAWGYDITLVASSASYGDATSSVTLSATTASAGTTITVTLNPPTGYFCPNSVINDGDTWEKGVYIADNNWDNQVNVNNGEGNKKFSFTMPAHDIFLFVIYKSVTSHSVTYHTPSCVDDGLKVLSGTTFAGPSTTDMAHYLYSYNFVGWTTSSSYSSTTIPSVLYSIGEPIPDDVDEVYAVFNGISSAFSKTNTLTDGADYMFFISDNASSSAADRNAVNDAIDTSKKRLNSTSVSVKSSATTCTDWSCIWTFVQGTGTYSSNWFIYSKQLGKYLGVTGKDSPTSSDRCMQLRDAKDDYTAWTASVSSGQITLTNKYRNDQSCSIKNLKGDGSNAGMYSNGQNLYLFGQGATTITYTTNPTGCPIVGYPVTYVGGTGATGSTVDPNSPYDEGDDVTIMANNFTKNGYSFTGWTTDVNIETKDGSDYYVAGDLIPAGKIFQIYVEDIVFTANWEPITYSVRFNKNDNNATGTMSNQNFTYDVAQNLTSNAFSNVGYVFTGWATSNNGAVVYTDGQNVSNLTAANGAIVDLYAVWSSVYTLSVQADVPYVKISTTTPSVINEGGSASMAEGVLVTLKRENLQSGYYWGGWNVYKTGDPSTKVTVSGTSTGATFAMPAYDVTINAYTFGDLVAFCEPEVEITLAATDGESDPLLITSGYGLGTSSVDASRTLRITVANASNNAVVNISGTDLKFFKTNGSRTEIGASNLTCTAGALSTDIIVAYAPSSYTDDNLATPSITVTCDGKSKTFDNLVKARCLPEKFVIAAKINGRWCALPADLATSSGVTVPNAYPISVDDENAPHVAKVAPKTAVYGFKARYAVTSHTRGIRFTSKIGETVYHLQAPRSNSLTYLWRTTNNSTKGMQEWYLTSKGSSDANFYTYYIGVDPTIKVTSGSGDGENEGDSETLISRYLCIYGDKIMWTSSEDETHRRFRILPIEKEAEPLNEIQVVEWASDKIRFMYLGDPTYKACVEISGVPKSAEAAVLGTSLKIDEGVYEIAVSDLMSNAYKQLYIVIKNGDTEIGRQAVTIPLMVNTTTDMPTATTGFTKSIQCPKMDLIVLPGGKLTSTYGAEEAAFQFKSVSVYGGGKLILADGKDLNAGNMYLRAGSVTATTKGATPVTTYSYVYPQVYLGDGSTLSVNGDVINFDYLTNYDQYFGVTFPYSAAINKNDITYPVDIYGTEYAKTGSFLLRAFDSKIRATQGAVDAVWVDVEKGNKASGGSFDAQANTLRGLGYYVLLPPRKVSVNGGSAVRQTYGIQRFKMDVSSLAETSDASIAVTTYSASSPYNTGWWMLGNPFMANLNGTGIGDTDNAITVGRIGTDNEGKPKWTETSVRYVTIPNDDASETYNQVPVSSYAFPAFKPFYVQVGATGTVTFAKANRVASAPKLFAYDDKMPAEVATSIALNSEAYGDTTHIIIGKAFSDEYEVGDDLIKMPHANVSLFTISNGTDLFSNALNAQSALDGIPVGFTAPTEGQFTFSYNDQESSSWIEHLWLIDNDMAVTTDLLDNDYNFISAAETNKTRFVLKIELKSEKDDPTTDNGGLIETMPDEGPIKFIYQDKLYIRHKGFIYDAVGKRVSEINK